MGEGCKGSMLVPVCGGWAGEGSVHRGKSAGEDQMLRARESVSVRMHLIGHNKLQEMAPR